MDKKDESPMEMYRRLSGSAREQQEEPEVDAGEARDRDETRRLLYMALVAGRTKKYNLVGTLVNALKHHQQIDEDVDRLFDLVIAAIDGDILDPDVPWSDGKPVVRVGKTEADAWVRERIQRISAELGN